jgi:hypothetical protein
MGGRQEHSNVSYSKPHPIVLHGKHPIVNLLICSEWPEHRRLLHGGPTLVITSQPSLSHHQWSKVCTLTYSAMCDLPTTNHQTPTTDVWTAYLWTNHSRPCLRKSWCRLYRSISCEVRKPTIVKTYLCVFVSLTVKVIHSDKISSPYAFFVARRGYPSLLWSDHGMTLLVQTVS